MKLFKYTFCIFFCTGFFLLGAEYSLDNILIKNPTIPFFGKNMKTAAGYFTIINSGEVSDKLTNVKANFAVAMIHKSSVDSNGVARMEHLEDVIIPANSSIKFEQGGLHIMLLNLKEPLVHMETKKITLIFKKAGKVNLNFLVKKATESSK